MDERLAIQNPELLQGVDLTQPGEEIAPNQALEDNGWFDSEVQAYQEGGTVDSLPAEEIEEKNLFSRVGARIGEFARERTPRKLTAGLAAAAIAVGGAVEVASDQDAEKAYAAPVAAKTAEAPDAQASSAKRVIHRRNKIKNQKILNRIHNILPDVDYTPNPKKYPIVITSAYLKPSEGGFTTNCRYKQDTFALRSYKITPGGTWFKRCTPVGNIWPDQTKVNEYKRPLNRLGRNVLRSLRVPQSIKTPSEQQVKHIRGSRKKVTVSYRCPEAIREPELESEASSSKGVSKIVQKGRRAAIYSC